MATSPKKKQASSSKKKRPLKTKKRTASRKTSRKRAQHSKRWGLGLIIFVVAFLLVALGYCLGSCWKKEHSPTVKPSVTQKSTPPRTVHKKVQKPAVAPHTKEHPKKVQPAQEKPQIKQVSKAKVEASKALPVSKLAYRGERARVVIIIDDVHTPQQLRTIQQLPIPVTPSIFPPYALSPHTAKLATQAVHYMVHLPMESGNAKFDRQSKTLKVADDTKQMQARLQELRRLFPRAHYINNHTGSKFTSNAQAMRRLYGEMKKKAFTFIDSRTTAKSTVRKIAHAFGDDYVARDIFLDNVKSVPAIHAQLKKAVRLAKKNGYAIAIGHPHKTTMQALREAKPLLKEVDVVYIDEIFRR